MVRTSTIAATASTQRARSSAGSDVGRPQVEQPIVTGGAHRTSAPNYGTVRPPAAYAGQAGLDHRLPASPTASSDPTIGPAGAGTSYHGQLRRADSPDGSSAGSSAGHSSVSLGSASSYTGQGDETAIHTLPAYSSFKLTHQALDMPLCLIILVLFLLLAVFGWPARDSPYPHHIHWKQLTLGAITWISTEAIRRRIFRFLGNSRFPLLRSTAVLLLLHTLFQELLRLFAVRLTFHHNSASPHIPEDPLPPSEPPSTELLRALEFVVTAPRPPKGFFKAFYLALGFAAAENIWQTLILLGQVHLYKDVLAPSPSGPWLVGEENVLHVDAPAHKTSVAKSVDTSDHRADEEGLHQHSIHGSAHMEASQRAKHQQDHHHAEGHLAVPEHHDFHVQSTRNSSILENEDFVTDAPAISDSELNAYIRERKRVEFEESFGGVALWDISVFVIAMWRLDSCLLNLSLTLLMSLPFHHNDTDIPPRRHPSIHVHLSLWPTFLGVVLLHWLLSLGWTLGIRNKERFSLAGISYVTLVGVLGIFFASLGVWSALI